MTPMTSWYGQNSGAWRNDICFLQTVSDLSGLPVALWLTGEAGGATRWASGGSGEHPCFGSEALRSALERYARRGEPCVYLEDNTFFYGAMAIGPFCLALGPAVLNLPEDAAAGEYAASHGISEPPGIVRTDLKTVSRYMRLMYCHFMGTAPAWDELPAYSDVLEEWEPAGALEEYELDQSENDRDHGVGIDYERRLLQAVRNGDVAGVKALVSGPTPNFAYIGELSGERQREIEYLTVSIITLMTRAAVAGGVRPEAAHEMGDVCLRKLARASANGESITPIGYRAMLEFAEAVSRSREEKHDMSYVDACKDYIQKNLRKDIQVGDIAPAVGISRTYLSRLFRQSEGITVQQYIQKEKCRHAARMLTYSDYSISQIAQYFGFSSQSYFGACFQAWYGMTPNAYRKANRGDPARG